MSAPIVKMFPAVPSTSSLTEDRQGDTEYELRNAVFGIHSLLKTNRCLITGQHASGRTSLLFQCALSYASEDQRVIFITHRRFQSMPLSVHGAPSPEPLLMKQIQFLYYQDRSSLLQYLASIHTNPICPDVLIVDDLDFYASHPQTQDISSTCAVLCAYLVDAAAFMETQKAKCPRLHGGHSTSQCLLMASVTSTSSCEVPLEHVYSSFLPTVLRISGMEGTHKVFQLSLHPNGTSQAACIVTYEMGDKITLLDYSMGESSLGMSQDFTQQ